MGDLSKLHYRYVATWEIWGNSTTGMSRHGRSEETPLQVHVCRDMGDLRKLHYRYVATWEIWRNSTTGMSRHGRSEETPLQVCRDMGDLRKLHYRWHASDLISWPITFTVQWKWRLWISKNLKLNCFLCYEYSCWLKRGHIVYSFNIHEVGSLTCDP
jgi:hypothetical protein